MDKTKQLEELEAFYKAFLTALYFEKYDQLPPTKVGGLSLI